MNSEFVHRWVRSPETATASGASFVMQLLREANCAATAGRPKCRSEVCSILTTGERVYLTRIPEKPAHLSRMRASTPVSLRGGVSRGAEEGEHVLRLPDLSRPSSS